MSDEESSKKQDGHGTELALRKSTEGRSNRVRFEAISKFAEQSVREHQMLMSLTDVNVASRVKFSFSYPVQVGTLAILRFAMRYSPWYMLALPYGIKCLYNVSGDIGLSIDSIVFRKDCFMLDLYKPRKGELVVDVGAYAGLYSILSSKLVGNGGVVIAIEPVPWIFRLLEKNVKLNDLSNVLPLNLALSGQDGEQDLYVPRGSTSGSSFYLEHLRALNLKEYRKMRIKLWSFDNLMQRIGLEHVDVMKVDVEGAELSVLQGACRSLKKCLVDRLVVEVHKTVGRPDPVVEFLKAYGYVVDGYFDVNEYVGMLYVRKKVIDHGTNNRGTRIQKSAEGMFVENAPV